MADRVAVMQAGRIVETGAADRRVRRAGASVHRPARRRRAAPRTRLNGASRPRRVANLRDTATASRSGRLDRRTFRHLTIDTVPPISNRSTMTDTARIPDKPALEGLEAELGRRVGARGHLPVRPRPPPPREQIYSIDTPPPTASGRCTSATCSATRTRTSSRASSACAASTSSTRWAGTTTACPPSAACRTTTACAATRPCPTTPTSCRRSRAATARARRPPTRCRSAAATSSSCASGSPPKTSSSSRDLWRKLGLSVDWSQTYRTIGDEAQFTVAARVPAQPRARRGLPGGRADAVGRHLPHRGRAGRARGPRAARALPPRDASTAPTAATIEIETTRPELHPGVRGPRRAPRRRALPAAVRHDRDHARLRRRGAGASRTTSPRRTRAPASR